MINKPFTPHTQAFLDTLISRGSAPLLYRHAYGRLNAQERDELLTCSRIAKAKTGA